MQPTKHNQIGSYTDKTLTITAKEAVTKLEVWYMSGTGNISITLESGTIGGQATTAVTLSNVNDYFPLDEGNVIQGAVIVVPAGVVAWVKVVKLY